MNDLELKICTENNETIVIKNCVQKLKPIINGHFHRDINGTLHFEKNCISPKFSSMLEITNQDLYSNFWLGSKVKIASIVEIIELITLSSPKIRLSRIPVDSSLVVTKAESDELISFTVEQNIIVFKDEILSPVNIKISMRPWLNMFVTHFEVESKNFGFDVVQKIFLEEI